MAKEISGQASCLEHGDFQWRGIYHYGEMICGKLSDLSENCGTIIMQGNEYIIPAICPKCKRKSIQKEKI